MGQTIEDLLPQADGSVYKLVRMASKRAVELAEGKPALVKPLSEKETSIALEEISKGKVVSKEVAEKSTKSKSK